MPAKRFYKDSQLVFDGLRMLRQVLLDAAIVDAKEFIRTGCHVNVVRLSLGTFFVHEFVNRITLGHRFYQTVHDLEQCFAQWRRTAF